MHRRLNRRGDSWVAGILSAIFFCLVVALGGLGGSSQVATANVVSPTPQSGGMDLSHQPSTRFLLTPASHAVASASKSNKGLGLGHSGDSGSAILPGELAPLEHFSEKQFVTVVQHAPSGDGNNGYNARAPPALI